MVQAASHDARTDGDLLAAAQRGDHAGFEALVTRYHGSGYRLAMALTRTSQEAEAVVQDAFLTLYRGLDRFRGDSTVSTWIYRVVANAAFVRLRTLRRQPLLSIEDQEPFQDAPLWPTGDWSKQPLETLLNQALRTEIVQAFARLPEKYRAVLVLRDVEGLDSAAAADTLGLTITAVETRLHRARLFVRGEIERYFRGQQ